MQSLKRFYFQQHKRRHEHRPAAPAAVQVSGPYQRRIKYHQWLRMHFDSTESAINQLCYLEDQLVRRRRITINELIFLDRLRRCVELGLF